MKVYLPLVFICVLSSCARLQIHTEGPVSQRASRSHFQSLNPKNNVGFWGLRAAQYDFAAGKSCDSGFHRVLEMRSTVWTLLGSFLTLGLWTPQSWVFWCTQGSGETSLKQNQTRPKGLF